MSKNPGKIFEGDIQDSAKKQGIWVLRLNDTSLSWMKEKNMRFTPTNIADFIIYKYPNLFLVECKSTEGKSISFQRTPEDSKGMIMTHQISDLINAGLAKGVFSILLLNYRENNISKTKENNIVYALSIENFSKFLENSDKNSINRQDCEQYKAITVGQKIKRTHYQYDIESMLDELFKRENEYKEIVLC